MTFRIADEKDFEAVHEIMYQIFEKHLLRRPDIYRQGEPCSKKRYMNSVNNKDDIIILAEIEKNIVGVCHMIKKEIPDYPLLKPGYTALIEDFGVHKDYLRRGIGKALYAQAVKIAKSWQVVRLELNVWEVNTEARKFYEAIGLTPKTTIMEMKLG